MRIFYSYRVHMGDIQDQYVPKMKKKKHTTPASTPNATTSSAAGPLCTLPPLTTSLRPLIQPNDTILSHSSLRKTGWIPGHAEALISATLNVLTAGGALVVPTHTGDNSGPGGTGGPGRARGAEDVAWCVVESDMISRTLGIHGERGRSGSRQSRRSGLHGVFVTRGRQVC
ncbi:hypothetical protein J3459_011390 [Metarhizium acridum]|nr:hypothetical protein J3459_011390 [Metarhizium acridum]